MRFAHDLVRESIAETTTQQRAVRLHLRVADALDHIHAGDEAVAERLGYHLWAATPSPTRPAPRKRSHGPAAAPRRSWPTSRPTGSCGCPRSSRGRWD
ncbi:hypothetical protein [Dactylosporangium sp. NPDC050588]|uniref:hypothetical protein n=1 Tax=Dactylosporangium sp. NPDC050588 TaxID=3157211 RepID=UPI0033E8894F